MVVVVMEEPVGVVHGVGLGGCTEQQHELGGLHWYGEKLATHHASVISGVMLEVC